MIRRSAALSLLLLFFVFTGSTLAAVPHSITPPYKITTIKALLFFEGSATFSTDVLAKKDFAFWNTIIGEGDAGAPSNSTLVLVEVSGKSSGDEVPPIRKVELTATTPQKPLVKRTVEIGSFGNGGKFYAAFWLYETGCQPVTLVARIIGQTQPSTVTRKIPFACGE
jgi:hypothetical protein